MSASVDTSKARAAVKKLVDNGTVVLPKRNGAGVALAKAAKFAIVLAKDFRVREDLGYYIKGLWGRDTFGVTYGPTGDGKTYVTSDMVLHIVSGTPWCGRRVHRAAVIYLAAEGPASIERRFIAMCDHKKLDRAKLPLAILSGALNMLKDPNGAIEAISAAAARLRAEFGPLDVILVIDTLARSAAGMDENGPEDMGQYVGVCDRIRRELGMACIVVHHTGKDVARGARGHGSLKAAADCELLVADRQIRIEKVRDGATGGAIPFTLQPMELGKDSDGDPITACSVAYGDEAITRTKRAGSKLPATSAIALAALQEAIQSYGHTMPDTSALPGGKPGCSLEHWRQRFYGRIADRDPEAQRKAFSRAKENLQAAKIIGSWETFVWIW